jgi:hypothetical protein
MRKLSGRDSVRMIASIASRSWKKKSNRCRERYRMLKMKQLRRVKH